MPYYTRLRDIPELLPFSPAERGRLWRRASDKAFRHWQTWAGSAAYLTLHWGGLAVGEALGYKTLFGAVGAGLGFGVAFHTHQQMALPYLRQATSALVRARAAERAERSWAPAEPGIR